MLELWYWCRKTKVNGWQGWKGMKWRNERIPFELLEVMNQIHWTMTVGAQTSTFVGVFMCDRRGRKTHEIDWERNEKEDRVANRWRLNLKLENENFVFGKYGVIQSDEKHPTTIWNRWINEWQPDNHCTFVMTNHLCRLQYKWMFDIPGVSVYQECSMETA